MINFYCCFVSTQESQSSQQNRFIIKINKSFLVYLKSLYNFTQELIIYLVINTINTFLINLFHNYKFNLCEN